MANGRNPGKRDTSRDPGGFVALPWSVLDSDAYKGLTVAAKALLLEVARQYLRDNNGRMLLSLSYLGKRGWHSAGIIQKAKQELIDAGLIFETVKGCRPNKASWYAATWLALDKLAGYDLDAERLFKRGAYRLIPAKPKRAAPSCKNPKKNERLIPPAGIERAVIVPPAGIEAASVVPSAGTIKADFDPLSIPPAGNHLEVPSTGARIEGAAVAPGPGSKGAKAGARPKRAALTCQHSGCSTLTLGRDFCRKHRAPEQPNIEKAHRPSAGIH